MPLVLARLVSRETREEEDETTLVRGSGFGPTANIPDGLTPSYHLLRETNPF